MFTISPGMLAQGASVAVTGVVGVEKGGGGTETYVAYGSAPGRPHAPRAWAALAQFTGVGGNAYVAALSNGGLTNGWAIRIASLNLTANIGNGAFRATPGENVASWAGDDTIHGIVCTYSGHTGSGDLKLYTDRSLVQSASFTGYTDTTNESFGIGRHGAGYGFAGILYGFVVCDTVPNLADVQQWFDDCKAASDVVDFVTGSSQVWSVRRGADGVPATWDEENGVGATVEKVGFPTRFENTSSLWGW